MGIRYLTSNLFELHPDAFITCSKGSLKSLDLQHIGIDASTLCLFGLKKGVAHFVLANSIRIFLNFMFPIQLFESICICFDGIAPKTKPCYDWVLNNVRYQQLPKKFKSLFDRRLARYFKTILISDTTEIGEAEQKALNHVCKQNRQQSMVFSTDSDVILSSLLMVNGPRWILLKSQKKQNNKYFLADMDTLRKKYNNNCIENFVIISTNFRLSKIKQKKLLMFLNAQTESNVNYKLSQLDFEGKRPILKYESIINKGAWNISYLKGQINPTMKNYNQTKF